MKQYQTMEVIVKDDKKLLLQTRIFINESVPDNFTALRVKTAVYNTYGKDINPEAVPELLAALNFCAERLDQDTGMYKVAIAAIQKATL